MPVRILVTRPQPDADATAAELRRRGCEPLIAPLLHMEPIAGSLPESEDWAGLLVTSANALRTLPADKIEAFRRLPLLAVGERTANAARSIGFTDVEAAGGDADGLLQLAATRWRGIAGPVLYIAGADRARDLAAALKPRGIEVHTAAVYRMNAVDRFPATVRQALADREIAGVLHYSRRSAAAYRACAKESDIEQAALLPVQYCLSEQVAVEFLATGASLMIAKHPTEESLLDLIPR